MKRLVILVLLICGIYFSKSMLIANEQSNKSKAKVEQTKDAPQVKDCCKDVKVGEKCTKCGKVKKADCCKETKVGEKCTKCDKVKKAACCKDVKVGEKCPKCGEIKKECPVDSKKNDKKPVKK